jgi:hypothetical protein
MNSRAILSFWGRKNLRRWPKRVLAGVRIHSSAKRFLNEVGLPPFGSDDDDWAAWPLRLGGAGTEDLPRLQDRKGLRVIGYNNEEDRICLDVARGGRVVFGRRLAVLRELQRGALCTVSDGV